uniref:DDE_Tnp_1_7 domain-containing protein n=1 Tax=Strongyloides stercoralis TaxID=6248 RepID=A0A913HC22_STRER
MTSLKKEEIQKILKETDDFSDDDDNGSYNERDNVEEDDVEDDYIDLTDNEIDENTPNLTDDEVPIKCSNNSKNICGINSSSDEDELPQYKPITKKRVKENNHVWFTEQPGTFILLPKKNMLKGKNNYEWSTQSPTIRKIPARNIIKSSPGPKGEAKNVSNPLEAWCLFFDEEMLDMIVIYTNQEIERQRDNYFYKSSWVKNTNAIEIRAYISLLYIAGARKDNHMKVEYLWSSRDPFTHIRSLWEKFIQHCNDNYTPSCECTIDEQLLSFKGNCMFRMYIPNKPDKYGIKLVFMCDSNSYYLVSGIPYIGKATKNNNLPLADYFVENLSKPIHGTYTSITVDNWFTSIPLVSKMLTEHKITMVGTLRRNKREIPQKLLTVKNRSVNSSIFLYNTNDKLQLTSFMPKKGKTVLLLSSTHDRSFKIQKDPNLKTNIWSAMKQSALKYMSTSTLKEGINKSAELKTPDVSKSFYNYAHTSVSTVMSTLNNPANIPFLNILPSSDNAKEIIVDDSLDNTISAKRKKINIFESHSSYFNFNTLDTIIKLYKLDEEESSSSKL